MLNFCPHCGKPYSNTAFCYQCGADLRSFIKETQENTHQKNGDHAKRQGKVKNARVALRFEDAIQKNYQKMTVSSLHAFLTEKHSNGKFEILNIKNKRELEITIPDGVDAIGEGAFEECAAFEINLPEGLMLIGKRAFANAKYLERINFPVSLKVIEDEAFLGCEQLDVTIPPSIRQGKDVLKGTKAERLAEKRQITEKEMMAFAAVSQIEYNVLIKYLGEDEQVVLPEGIVAIDVRAFEYNRSLKSVSIPSSVASIETGAFVNCWGLTTLHVHEDNPKYHSAGNCIIETGRKKLIVGCAHSQIPDDGSVTSIGGWAFFGCVSLKKSILPQQITSIEHDAFYGCRDLSMLKLNDGLREIGTCAFYNCESLTSMTIPESVMSIGKEAFGNRGHASCLKSITLPRRFEDSLARIGIDPERTKITFT